MKSQFICIIGGVIGDVKDIEVDLSEDKLQQYCFTDKEFDIKEALYTSYSILELASEKITIPKFEGVYSYEYLNRR